MGNTIVIIVDIFFFGSFMSIDFTVKRRSSDIVENLQTEPNPRMLFYAYACIHTPVISICGAALPFSLQNMTLPKRTHIELKMALSATKHLSRPSNEWS